LQVEILLIVMRVHILKRFFPIEKWR